MNIEADNLKAEIKESIQKCIRCGLCKSHCSVYKVVREEYYSPRGQVIMLDNQIIEKIIYDCNLCKACEIKCPLDLKLCSSFINARKILVLQKKEIKEVKEIIKNLNNSGNIIGK